MQLARRFFRQLCLLTTLLLALILTAQAGAQATAAYAAALVAAPITAPITDTAQLKQGILAVTPHLAILEDSAGRLTLAEVQDPAMARVFRALPANEGTFSIGYSRSAYWLQFSVRNRSQLPQTLMLQAGYPGLTNFQAFLPTPEGHYQTYATGLALPFSSRPYPNRGFIFPLTIAPESQQTIYLRVQSTGPIGVPVQLWERAAFYAEERNDYIAHAWYFGIASAMVLFNLLLFIALRDRLYLYYVLFISAMSFALATKSGLIKEFVLQDASLWSTIATPSCYALTLAAALLFMRKMLDTRRLLPRIDVLYRGLIGFFLLVPFALVVLPNAIVGSLIFLYALVGLLIISTGVYCALQRQHSAYYFVAAFALLSIAGVVTALTAFGVINTTRLTTNAIQIASAVEMLLLAFALADRFNEIRRERAAAQGATLAAQEKMLANLQASERALEGRVERRTMELEKMNLALKEAMASLEDVERIARHDLKTPLGSVAAAPALLRAGRIMPPDEELILCMIEQAANRALDLVNLSLDLYKMETGTYVCHPQPFNFTLLIDAVIADLQAQAQSKGVLIQFTGQAPHQWANALESLCYSILANLTKNALEAAPENSVVLVHLQGGPQLMLRIQNLGVVPIALRDQFFAKYATNSKLGGTGLGNYSSQLLAKVQGGSLSMDSNASGTTLSLVLPAAEKSAPPGSGLIQTMPNPESDDHLRFARRVVLAEDDDFNRMIVHEQLQQTGILIDDCINGRQALDAVRLEWPELIIMDIEMPVMGGVEAMQRIRDFQHHAGQAPSIIVAYSAHDDAASQAHYLALGFDRCLSKPSRNIDLQALIAALPEFANV